MSRLRSADAKRRRARDFGPDFLESLERGLAVLSAFDDQKRQVTLSDVARTVALPKSSVRRALHTLADLGFIRVEGRLYHLTPNVLKLANAYVASNGLSLAAQPLCERIADQVNEPCSFAVMFDQDIVMIAHGEPHGMQSIGAGIGYRLPAFRTTLGRVILASLDDDALAAFLKAVALKAETSFTVSNRKDLRSAILKARKQGYALADQENQYGFRAIAVPVVHKDGTTVGALNIVVRIEHASLDQLVVKFLPVLRQGALDLGASI
jgi:IclR family pca regulon transcriptional regulator